MKYHQLNNMERGWFIGNFYPTALTTSQFEVGIKSYRSGETEAKHYHKIATEVTAIISGTVRMCGKTWSAGDIITVEPGEATDFEAITDTITVVVKTPCVAGDKYHTA